MSNIINLITKGKNTEAKESINSILYAKTQERLDDLKKVIANKFFKQ